MNSYFGSCAKSAISVDSDPCERESCVQLWKKWQKLSENTSLQGDSLANKFQLVKDLDRQQRKIALLQRAKHLLNQQLSLSLEENEHLKKRINKLQQFRQIQKVGKVISEDSRYNPDLSIIFRQKEQQIDILTQTLKTNKREISQLRFSQSQLEQQLQSKVHLLSKIKESTDTQLMFYQEQIQQLQQELTGHKLKIARCDQDKKQALNIQEQQYHYSKNILGLRITSLEQQNKEQKQKIYKINRKYHQLVVQKEQGCQFLAKEQQRIKWLSGIIQESKISYIHQELKKQQIKQKQGREKTKKRHKGITYNGNKSYRSISEASTSLPSAKTQHRLPHSSIAPFELSPINQSRLDLEWPTASPIQL